MNTNKARILILGCGYTLTRLALRFNARDLLCIVSGTQRSEELIRMGLNSQVVDASDFNQIRKLFKDNPQIEILIDGIPPLYKYDHNPLVAAKNITSCLNYLNPRRIIYLSTTGVYGVGDSSWVSEERIPEPRNTKSQARLETENLYRNTGIPAVILRIAGIYGPDRGLGHSLKIRRKISSNNPEKWNNRIHVEDLVEVIYRILQSPLDLSLPQIFNCCDDLPVKSGELLEFYALASGLNKEELNNLLPSDKHTASLRDSLNQRISNKLVKKTLNLELAYPSYKEGYRTELLG